MSDVQASPRPHASLIASRDVTGTSVYDASGEKLGSVDDIMIDKLSGKIAYAVLSFGGFLGIGDKQYPLPWAKLHYDTTLGGYVVDLAKEKLEGAPSYATGDQVAWNDEAWGRRVHDHYNVAPWWGIPAM
jgi:sporulation protein YlmC with PRC-barrel domain